MSHSGKKKNKAEKNTKQVMEIAATLKKQNRNDPISSDVLGSYTGMTADREIPVQDADDL